MVSITERSPDCSDLHEPIKALGEYKVDVRVAQGVESVVALSVVPAET